MKDELERARTKHDEIAVKLRRVEEYAGVLKEDKETLLCENFILKREIKRFRRLYLCESAGVLEPCLRRIGYPTAGANFVTFVLQGMEAEMKEKEAKKKEEREKLITSLAFLIDALFRFPDSRFMTTSQGRTGVIFMSYLNGES